MEEQANKILVELLQKASNGIDAAVSFSQAQIPDVVHQLLLWNMVDSLIKTLIAILTIPLVFWFMKKQCQRVETGKIGDEGYSWEKGNPKYRPTMVWDSKGDINLLIMPLVGVLTLWGDFYYWCSNQYDLVKNLAGPKTLPYRICSIIG